MNRRGEYNRRDFSQLIMRTNEIQNGKATNAKKTLSDDSAQRREIHKIIEQAVKEGQNNEEIYNELLRKFPDSKTSKYFMQYIIHNRNKIKKTLEDGGER